MNLLPIFDKLQARIRLETDQPVRIVGVKQKGDKMIVQIEEEDKKQDG